MRRQPDGNLPLICNTVAPKRRLRACVLSARFLVRQGPLHDAPHQPRVLNRELAVVAAAANRAPREPAADRAPGEPAAPVVEPRAVPDEVVRGDPGEVPGKSRAEGRGRRPRVSVEAKRRAFEPNVVAPSRAGSRVLVSSTFPSPASFATMCRSAPGQSKTSTCGNASSGESCRRRAAADAAAARAISADLRRGGSAFCPVAFSFSVSFSVSFSFCFDTLYSALLCRRASKFKDPNKTCR